MRLYDAKTKKVDYAGRVDTLAHCSGVWEGVTLNGIIVLDWKSSKEPTSKKGYPEWGLQISAYRDGTEQSVHFDYKVDGNAVIRLDKFSGVPTIYDYSSDYEDLRREFYALLRYYRIAKRDQIAKGKVPSVTTVLNVLAKPALIQWAANCSRDYILQELEKAIPVDCVDLFDPMIPKSDVVKWANEAPKNFRKVGKVATDIGTSVHKFIEMDLKGDPALETVEWNQVPMEVESAFDAYLKFKRAINLEVLEVEYEIQGSVD